MAYRMSSKRLAAYLKSLRPGNKPTLGEIARKAGFAESFLRRLESATYATVSVDTLKQVAAGYGVPFETLLKEAGYVEGESPEVPELSTYLRTHVGLSEEGVKEVESFIDYAKGKYGKRPRT